MKPLNRKNCIVPIKTWSINKTSDQLSYYKNKFNRFHIDIQLDSYDNYGDFTTLINHITKSNINIACCDFSIEVKETLFNKRELSNIEKFNDFLEENNSMIFFKEHDTLWNMDEIHNTYNFIDETVNKIKANNLSPLEKFLYAYKTVTSKVYNREDITQNALLSRSIFGITNSDKICCVGYSEWLKEICNKLEDKNLVCYSNSYKLFDKNTLKKTAPVGHRFNIVYIDDEKYNVKGFFVADACWDSKLYKEDIMSLSFCLIPIDDLTMYAYKVVGYQPTNPFQFFLNQQKPTLLKFANSTVREFLQNQKMINLDLYREKFKLSLIAQYKKTLTKDNMKQKLNEINKILSTNPFGSEQIEYSFLKYTCNKIKTQSMPLLYDNYVNALWQVCLKCENMDTVKTKEYVEKVISKTKNVSFKQFTKGAKNEFAVLAKAEFDRRQALREQIAKRRELIKAKRNKDKEK